MVMQKTQKMSHAAHAKTVWIIKKKKMHTAEKCGREMKMLN